MDFQIVRNSWGPYNFGIKGYVRYLNKINLTTKYFLEMIVQFFNNL